MQRTPKRRGVFRAHSLGLLIYIAGDSIITSAPIRAGSTFVPDKPGSLFRAGQSYVNVARDYDVSRDGKRFIMVRAGGAEARRPSFVVVTHWDEELWARMGKN
jgi:hypothetical protein